MRLTLGFAVIPAFALAAGLVSLAPAAMAQSSLPMPTGMGPVVQGNNGPAPAQLSQPGLPGAGRARGGTRKGNISSDSLSPNVALFDAIDRGDLGAARDALARGADLQATNAVGQTPIDESVGLGRNDITFVLVTLLHAEGADIADAQGPMNAPPATTLGLSNKDAHLNSQAVSFFSGNPAAAKKRAERKQAAEAVRLRNRVTPTSRPAPAPAYGGGSGAPVPASGFLGFGGNGSS